MGAYGVPVGRSVILTRYVQTYTVATWSLRGSLPKTVLMSKRNNIRGPGLDYTMGYLSQMSVPVIFLGHCRAVFSGLNLEISSGYPCGQLSRGIATKLSVSCVKWKFKSAARSGHGGILGDIPVICGETYRYDLGLCIDWYAIIPVYQ